MTIIYKPCLFIVIPCCLIFSGIWTGFYFWASHSLKLVKHDKCSGGNGYPFVKYEHGKIIYEKNGEHISCPIRYDKDDPDDSFDEEVVCVSDEGCWIHRSSTEWFFLVVGGSTGFAVIACIYIVFLLCTCCYISDMYQDLTKNCQIKRMHKKSSKSLKKYQINRPQRLNQNNIMILYHQTSFSNALSILKDSKFNLSSSGMMGSGIYFAETPEDANRKATHAGAILKCTVKMGNMVESNISDTSFTFESVLSNGYDSVKATFRKGNEYVVYNSDQVVSMSIFSTTQFFYHQTPYTAHIREKKIVPSYIEGISKPVIEFTKYRGPEENEAIFKCKINLGRLLVAKESVPSLLNDYDSIQLTKNKEDQEDVTYYIFNSDQIISIQEDYIPPVQIANRNPYSYYLYEDQIAAVPGELPESQSLALDIPQTPRNSPSLPPRHKYLTTV